MSSNDFDFNIDSILEEFSLYSESIGGSAREETVPAAPYVPAEDAPLYQKSLAPETPVYREYPSHGAVTSRERAYEKNVPAEENSFHTRAAVQEHPPRTRSSHSAPAHGRSDYDLDAFYRLKEDVKKASPPQERSRSSASRSFEDKPVTASRPARRGFDATEDAYRTGRDFEGRKASPDTRRRDEEKLSRRENAKPASRPQPEADEKPRAVSPLTPVLGIICSLLLVAGLIWVVFNVHPGTATAAVAEGPSQRLDMTSRLDVYLNNMASDALGDLSYIRRVYKIDENATFAPAPNQNRYGILPVSDADKVLEIIQSAKDSGLLEGQEVCFSPDANFYWDSDIQYYYDETILVICWKEQIDGKVCSFAEVKIADASQFRRKITEDTYGSSVKQYASQLSASANAVVAMNADFYAFRTLGMVVYQRQLYRYNASNYNSLDHCFIDSSGNFQFLYRWTEMSEDAVRKYLEDNDILFGLAFGPILVDNGNVVPCDSYPAGEINTEYSRAGIGQLDALHYLYITVNWSNENTPRATVGEFANIFHSKGVKNAYCLDGGQTSEIVMNDIPYSRIDYNAERTVSDIIYFATAIPETEVTK